jgi:hypothetical protein
VLLAAVKAPERCCFQRRGTFPSHPSSPLPGGRRPLAAPAPCCT